MKKRSGLLQCFFRWLYHGGAWAYDGVAAMVSAGRWTHWGMRALEYVQGAQVLEIGPGPGHLLAEMVQRGLHPVGLELSFPMARRAQRRTGFAVPLAQGRAQALPFPDRAFDAVVTTFPAPFIREPATWREAARVLRPGGRFIVLLGAWPGGPTRLARVFRLLYRWATRPDERASARAAFRLLAQEVGMELEEWSVWDGPWRLWGMIAIRGEDPPAP